MIKVVRGKKRYILRHPERLFLLVILAVLVLSIPIGLSARQPEPIQYSQYIVKNGDTLWDIAMSLDTDDIRETLYEIVSYNNLSTCELHIGQKLMLPVYNDSND